MVPWNLLAASYTHYVIPHLDHCGRQIASCCTHVLDQRGGERRIAAIAVQRHVAGLSGIRDKGAESGRCCGEAPADCCRPRAHCAREVARQWVVSASIENNDRRLALAIYLHLAKDELEFDGLELQVTFALQFCIDRHEVVLKADLQPMPRIEEQRHV